MPRYILQRIVLTAPTAFLVILMTFLILHLVPGDPARLIVGEDADPATIEAVRHNLGLDRPLPEQFVRYVGSVMSLDLGRSLQTRELVTDQLATRLPKTLELAGAALAIATVAGIALGLTAAMRYGSMWDFGAMLFSTTFIAAPTFWLGLILIAVFAVTLGWFPAAGATTPQHIVLPAIALAAAPLALILRLVRSECLEALGEDYVRTAHAKGLRERVVISRHVLKNTLLPVVTVLGLQLGSALGGAVVAEAVFAWPGVGQMIVQGIFQRDFPVVQGALLVIALGLVVTNLLVDVAYAYLDPRIRYG